MIDDADRISQTTPLSVEIERLLTKADPQGDRTTQVAKTVGGSRALQCLWKDIVGSEVAKNTHSLYLRGNEMVVTVSSPVWAQELSLFSTLYQEKLNNALGAELIKSIRYKTKK